MLAPGTTNTWLYDIFVSQREDAAGAWGTPVNLGSQINTSASETGPSIFEDEATGKTILYFTSSRSGTNKIYQTELLEPDNPGPPSEVTALNFAGASDWHAFVRRRDGLEVIFASNRGGLPKSDLFASTRPSTSAPWSTPVNLGPKINDPARDEGRPSLSWDGTALYFWSDREKVNDTWRHHMYMAERKQITGRNT